MFLYVWLHFKKFSEKYFLVFGEEEGKDKPRRRRRRRDLDLREIAIDVGRSHRSSIEELWRSTSGAIAPSIAIYRIARWSMSGAIDERARWMIAPLVNRAARRTIAHIDERRDRRSVLSDLGSLFSLSFSLRSGLSLLSLSLFFRKWFEVKMRVENHFRVKGENFGQQEAIFRKMKFTVAAKHLGLGENDFLKSFSPKTNAPLRPNLQKVHGK